MKKPIFSLFSISILFLFLPFGKWKKFKKLNIPDQYSYIPSGKMRLNMDTEETVSLKGFFMSSHEVTNEEYLAFYKDLKAQSRTEELELAKVDEHNWPLEFGEPYKNNYYYHPAYAKYPVVNISHEAALLYCKWLEQKLSTQNEGRYDVKVKLPSEMEWKYAAHGGHDFAPYPWGGYYFKNSKGCVLANFKVIGEERIRRIKGTDQYEVVPSQETQFGKPKGYHGAPVKVDAYFPNDYGLYQMVGNVAEMLDQPGQTKGGSWNSTGYHIRIDSDDEYEGWNKPSPYIGFRPMILISPCDKD